jgi:aldehyde dehydrogenase (NAD+)
MTTVARLMETPAVTPTTDVADLVARMRSSYRTGRTRSIRWRQEQLDALVRMLSEQEKAICDALADDLGRSAGESWLTDIAGTVMEARYARKRLAKWARDERVTLPLSTLPARGTIRREPLGTVLIIGAWNYPFYLTLGPLVGAIAAGNTVVIKPSELAPKSSSVLAELVARYLDPAAVTVVEGDAATTQALLAEGFDHCLFTGSAQTGKRIMEAAAQTLTPVTLELGGKSPIIVTADANVEVAARRIAWAKLTNSGQTCITTDYVLVELPVRDKLLDALAATIREFRKDEQETGQPIVNQGHHTRLVGLLEGHGGTIVCGGRTDADGITIEPTVIADPDPDSPLMQEEIFGPLLPVITVASVEEAIDFVGRRPKPLAAYVFTSNAGTRRKIVDSISAGGMVINHIGLHCLSPQLPFGGVGMSGMGSYHGRWGFETFSHRKAVVRKWARPDPSLLYPPLTAAKLKVLRRFF